MVGKLLIIEEEVRKVPRRGWAEMIRKVYEVDPLLIRKGNYYPSMEILWLGALMTREDGIFG